MLDAFAHAETALGEYQKLYRHLQTLVAEQAELSTAEAAREQELDLLRHQVNEIAAAKLDAAEEEEIETRYKLANNSKRLTELASAVVSRLAEADDAVLSQLAETQRLLRELEKIDPALAELATSHAGAVVELSEIARSLGNYVEHLDLDPQQLATLEQRVSTFETLKRKYGGSIAEVIAFGERAAERMQRSRGAKRSWSVSAKEIERTRGEMMRARKRCGSCDAKRHRSSRRRCGATCATSGSSNRRSKRN